jgi:uncharacterized protein YndB with AHSA1/START domain
LKRDLKFEVTYGHTPEKVWRALTDPQAISQWLMPNDFEPRAGHKFQFRTKPQPGFDGVVNCEVLEIDPPRKLIYSWCGGDLRTVVAWTLQATAQGGTRLTLEHTGFAGLKGWMVSRMLGRGWGSRILVRNLPAILEAWTGDGPVPMVPEAQCTQD